jgi:hypothetical protein
MDIIYQHRKNAYRAIKLASTVQTQAHQIVLTVMQHICLLSKEHLFQATNVRGHLHALLDALFV